MNNCLIPFGIPASAFRTFGRNREDIAERPETMAAFFAGEQFPITRNWRANAAFGWFNHSKTFCVFIDNIF
jgi:hypothetical protein